MAHRTLTLTKDGHKYAFRYPAGRERDVMEHVIRMAEQNGGELDWLDAAMLGFQASRQAAEDCIAELTGDNDGSQ